MNISEEQLKRLIMGLSQRGYSDDMPIPSLGNITLGDLKGKLVASQSQQQTSQEDEKKKNDIENYKKMNNNDLLKTYANILARMADILGIEVYPGIEKEDPYSVKYNLKVSDELKREFVQYQNEIDSIKQAEPVIEKDYEDIKSTIKDIRSEMGDIVGEKGDPGIEDYDTSSLEADKKARFDELREKLTVIKNDFPSLFANEKRVSFSHDSEETEEESKEEVEEKTEETKKEEPKQDSQPQWDSRLTQDQIDEAISRDIYEPAGPEYEQYLGELGLKKEEPKKDSEPQWDPRLTQEQIDEAISRDIYEPVGPEYEQYLNEIGLSSLSRNNATPDAAQPVQTVNTQQPGQPAPAGNTQQPGQPVPSGNTQQPGQPVPAGNTQQPAGNTQQPGQPVPAGNTQQPGQPVPAGNTQQPGQPVPAGNTQQPGQPVPAGNTQQPGQPVPAGNTQQPGQPTPAGNTQQPNQTQQTNVNNDKLAKKAERKAKLKKALKATCKGALFIGGINLGVMAQRYVPVIGGIVAGIKIVSFAGRVAAKGINAWTTKNPDKKISKWIKNAKENAPDGLKKAVNKVRSCVNNPYVKATVNGFFIGYVASSVYEGFVGKVAGDPYTKGNIAANGQNAVGIGGEAIPAEAQTALMNFSQSGRELEFVASRVDEAGRTVWGIAENGKILGWFPKDQFIELAEKTVGSGLTR